MAVYSIKKVQCIPCSVEQAWDFFSNPANLAQITPEKMAFKTISSFHGDQIYPGQIIEYTIKPLLGIRLYWMTEITHVKEHQFFVDEQRRGPYALWHHQHHFKQIPGGVEMTDIVHYKNPFWLIGDLANRLFVKRQLREVFEYRFVKIEALFGAWK